MSTPKVRRWKALWGIGRLSSLPADSQQNPLEEIQGLVASGPCRFKSCLRHQRSHRHPRSAPRRTACRLSARGAINPIRETPRSLDNKSDQGNLGSGLVGNFQKAGRSVGAMTMRVRLVVRLPVLSLLVLGAWVEARAAQCDTTSACVATPTSPGCDLRVSTSWTCGHAPRATDHWDIRPGHTAIVKTSLAYLSGLGIVQG